MNKPRILGYLTILVLSLQIIGVLALLTSPAYVRAQEEVPRVITTTISRDTVYRGYQTIEVVSYIYLPPGSSLREISGTAVLSSGGMVQNLSMVRVTLTAPTTIIVDNKSYEIRNLLIVRVPVSPGMIPGKGVLTVTVRGTAVMGDTTYDLSRTFTFTISILDSAPVEVKRLEALLSLQRARTMYEVLQGMGVSVPQDLVDMYSQATITASRADEFLYSLGDVDTALVLYDEVIDLSTKVATNALLLISSTFLSTNTSLQSILTRLDTVDSSIKALNESVVSMVLSIETLSEGLQELAKAFQSYSTAVSNSINTINNNLNAIDAKYDRSVKNLGDEINSKLNDLVNSTNENFRNLGSTLSAIQIGLVVLGVAVLVIGVLSLLRR